MVDENIPLMTVAMLRSLNHEVLDIRGTPDEGMPDPDLWSKSQFGENEWSGFLVVMRDAVQTVWRSKH